MLKIEIHQSQLRSFNWQDKKGVNRTGYKQDAYVHLPEKPFPVGIQLRVDDPSKQYAPGLYQLSESSFWVDRFGSLACNPVLIPVTDKKGG